MKEKKAEILLEVKNSLNSDQIISQGQIKYNNTNKNKVYLGAEAKIYKIENKNKIYIVKQRFKKCYRVDQLDQTVIFIDYNL